MVSSGNAQAGGAGGQPTALPFEARCCGRCSRAAHAAYEQTIRCCGCHCHRYCAAASAATAAAAICAAPGWNYANGPLPHLLRAEASQLQAVLSKLGNSPGAMPCFKRTSAQLGPNRAFFSFGPFSLSPAFVVQAGCCHLAIWLMHCTKVCALGLHSQRNGLGGSCARGFKSSGCSCQQRHNAAAGEADCLVSAGICSRKPVCLVWNRCRCWQMLRGGPVSTSAREAL